MPHARRFWMSQRAVYAEVSSESMRSAQLAA